MKKTLLSAVVAASLILTLGGAALADGPETSAPAVPETECYTPGDVPAAVPAQDAMAPAIHAALLAMLNNGDAAFAADSSMTAWEALYNMLSIYGQLDARSEYRDGQLVLPTETVLDYAAALFPSAPDLTQLPASLADRMVYDADSDSYLLACGDDGLSEIQVRTSSETGGQLTLSGGLVYLVDGSELASFTAVLAPRDSLCGYQLVSLTMDA